MNLPLPLPRRRPAFGLIVAAGLAAAGVVAVSGGSAVAQDASLASAAASPAGPAPVLEPAVIPHGITKPSVRSELRFANPGIVQDVPVRDGDQVKAGQVLIQQDDRIDKKQLESLSLEADSDVRIVASQADQRVKQLELKRLQDMFKKRSATEAEMQEAEVKVAYADAQVKIATLEKAKATADRDRQQLKIDQERMTSPIDGIVEMVKVTKGELGEPSSRDPAAVVVRLDPLWVEINVPAEQALPLNVGDTMAVSYGGASDKARPAKVIHLAPVLDASSNTRLVRLEMPNPENKPAGLDVDVKLPQKPVASGVGN